MSLTSRAASQAGRQLAPKITQMAPGLTTTFVREALHRAIVGVGPLPPAAKAADAQLKEQKGNRERAVHEVIENHVRYAGAQGFVTNIGGIVTMAVTIPANVSGLALIQCRMIAGIAHLRGYDLDDPRVRNAILTCLLGEDTVNSMIKQKKLPAPPMALATAPVNDPDLDRILSAEVASELITKVAGKRLAITVGRRVPIVGGVVGLSADAYSDLADRPLRRPGASAPRSAVDLQHPLARKALLQPADDLLAQPVRRPEVGALQREVCLVELAVQPLLLATQPALSSSRALIASTAASAT